MIAGERNNFSIPIGSALTLNSTMGSALVYRLADGAGDPGSPVNVAGTTDSYGPFGEVRGYRVECQTGTVTASVARVPGASLSPNYSKIIRSGNYSTVYIPAGSRMVIAPVEGGAVGSVIPVSFSNADPGTPIAFDGSQLVVGPFADLTAFRVKSDTGRMDVQLQPSIGPVTINLGAISLSGALTVGTATTGTIIGTTVGSTLSTTIPGITINSGARTYSGTPTTAGPYIVTETLVGAANSPRTTNVTVNAAGAIINLAALTLSAPLQVGTAVNGTINGATAGSTITGNIPGITVNSAARTYSGTPTTAASFNLTETLAGAANSPRTTAVTVDAAGGALTLAQKGMPAVWRNGLMPVSYTETTPGVYGHDYSEATFATSGTMYYVSATGNDANDGLSTGAAKRQIQSAIDGSTGDIRITVPTGGRYAPFTVPTGRKVSLYGPSTRDAFVGDLLTEADVSVWGGLANDRQSVTLTTGTVSGFVDLTKTHRADRQGRPIPQVSKFAATAAEIATFQANVSKRAEQRLYGTALGTAMPIAGVFRSTPSQVGTSDKRSLQGSLDTTVMMWRTTAAAPFTLVGTAQLFAKNMSWVGGGEALVPAAAKMTQDNCRHLGAHGQAQGHDGQSVKYRCSFRNCSDPTSDVIDYSSNGGANILSTAVEIESFFDFTSRQQGNNGSTMHGGRLFAFDSIYLDGSRAINDVNNTMELRMNFITQGEENEPASRSLAFGGGEAHYVGVDIIPGAGSDMMFSKTAADPASSVYVYDDSLDGKTQGTSTTGAQFDIFPIKRVTARPSGDTTFVNIDPIMSNLFQDAAGQTPVTATGQPVARVNNVGPNGAYALIPATTTYELDGARPLLRMTGNTGGIQLVSTTVMDESCNMVIGLKTVDQTGFMLRLSGTNSAGRLDAAGASPTGIASGSRASPGYHNAAQAYAVDGNRSNPTTGTTFRAAVSDGTPHVVTVKGMNLYAAAWERVGIDSATGMLALVDCDLYGLEISRATTTAALQAREAPMATKAGATLV